MDLIERRKLWFSRADKFEDPLEGTLTDAEIVKFRSLQRAGQFHNPNSHPYSEIFQTMRGTIFANCWRQGAHESMAMWDIYGKGPGVVAIKSTVGLLKEAVASYEYSVFISEVNYVDWNHVSWSGRNALQVFTRKDVSYSHEAEVRAIIWGLARHPGRSPLFEMSPDNDMTKIPSGVEVDVDPSRLITQVMIGPREQARICNLVQAIMKRYGLPQEIRASDRLKERT